MTNQELEETKSRIVVLGCGYLGSAFKKQGFTVMRHYFNDFKMLKDYDVVINTVGYSDTRAAERPENRSEVMKLNFEFPLWLASNCEKEGKLLVHFSTGCMYHSSAIPQSEKDKTSPACMYVYSKMVGEKAIDRDKSIILRPRLYFDDTPSIKNLLVRIMSFTKFSTSLNSLTSLRECIDASWRLIMHKDKPRGIFNCACDGYKTIAEIAEMYGDIIPEVKMPHQECVKDQPVGLAACTLDLAKIKKFYGPGDLTVELRHNIGSLREKFRLPRE